MLEIEEVIEDYVLGWNSSKAEDRLLLMKKVLAENCLYLDSHLPEPVDNIETHCQLIESFRAKFPEISLQLSAAPDSHHRWPSPLKSFLTLYIKLNRKVITEFFIEKALAFCDRVLPIRDRRF